MELVSESIFETEHALSIQRAILPEIETPVSDRSDVELSATDSSLELRIKAKDIISMRSALNTWLRLIQVAHEISQLKHSLDQE